MKIRFVSLSLVIVLFASGGQAMTTVMTQPTWNGESVAVLPFGEPGAATFGQTFTVGLDRVLSEFSFWHGFPDLGGPSVLRLDFAGYVMEWSGSRAIGSVLYRSDDQEIAGFGMQRFRFDTGHLRLEPGREYVAFLSASELFDGTAGQTEIGGRPQVDTYSDGRYVFQNNGSNTDWWTTQSWGSLRGNDVAFEARFVVPEPSTLLLVGFGIAGLSIRRRW